LEETRRKSYRIVGEGKVSLDSQGAADVTLSDVEGRTELSTMWDAKVGGKLAATRRQPHCRQLPENGRSVLWLPGRTSKGD
jgi:hypothetical protein